MTLKRPVTLAAARRWPAAAARRESFCARMGGMREKLTSDRTARDPRSKINRALAAWDCDEPELLGRKHVTKGIRPMKITQKMVGAEARGNPAQKVEVMLQGKLPNGGMIRLQKRAGKFDIIINSTGYAWHYVAKGTTENDARSVYDYWMTMKNPAPALIKWEMYDPQSKTQRAMVGGVEVLVTPVRSAAEARSYEMPDWTRAILEVAPDKLHANTQLPHGSVREAKDPLNVAGAIQFARKDYKPKTNPRRKPTVSRKISQLTREGYPQRQAVAIALSEQRAGKVRANPAMKDHMVYQVQHSRDGKLYEVWATFMYPEMAKDVARRRAKEAPTEFVRVVSFKVKA